MHPQRSPESTKQLHSQWFVVSQQSAPACRSLIHPAHLPESHVSTSCLGKHEEIAMFTLRCFSTSILCVVAGSLLCVLAGLLLCIVAGGQPSFAQQASQPPALTARVVAVGIAGAG